MPDPIVEAVRSDLDARSARGVSKYGTTLARTDLSLRDWLQHAYEEALDLALYLRRAMDEPQPDGFAAGVEAMRRELLFRAAENRRLAESAVGYGYAMSKGVSEQEIRDARPAKTRARPDAPKPWEIGP